MREPVKDFAIVTVNGRYDETATQIALVPTEISLIPDPANDGEFWATWYNDTDYPEVYGDPKKERIKLSDITAGVATIVRAQDDTAASTKNISGKTYKLLVGFSKRNYDEIFDRLETIEGKFIMSPTATNLTLDPASYAPFTFLYNYNASKLWINVLSIRWDEITGGSAAVNGAILTEAGLEIITESGLNLVIE